MVRLDELFDVVNYLLVNIANGVGWYKGFKKATLSCHQHHLHHSTSSSQHHVRKFWSLPSIYRIRMRFRQYGTPEGVHYLSVVPRSLETFGAELKRKKEKKKKKKKKKKKRKQLMSIPFYIYQYIYLVL